MFVPLKEELRARNKAHQAQPLRLVGQKLPRSGEYYTAI
jgi:hypothetical protein